VRKVLKSVIDGSDSIIQITVSGDAKSGSHSVQTTSSIRQKSVEYCG